MKSPFLFVLFCSLAVQGQLSAQGVTIPLGNDAYQILDRLEIKTGISTNIHTTHKGYVRKDVTDYAYKIDTSATPLSSLDRADLYYIFRDNNEWLVTPEDPKTLRERNPTSKGEQKDGVTWYSGKSQVENSMEDSRYTMTKRPLLKYFYRTPANFFEVDKKNFYLRVNPILNFNLAKAVGDTAGLVFQNTRGVELRGGIDDRVYFYTNILETQQRFPDFVTQRIQKEKTIPGNNLYKGFRSTVFNIKDGYDFLNAFGYIGFNLTKHIGLQFGHGNNFLGNGYRSLLLSDYADGYLYLKANTRIWKFDYQNIFAELVTESNVSNAAKKYIAMHHFNYKLRPNLQIGLFEAVVYSRSGSKHTSEWSYFNPIIFYRAIEHRLGSADNALVGIDGKWNVGHHFSLYGQILLDEFNFGKVIERKGWWANKIAIQTGLKYINVANIDHLDAQFEFNYVRPFTYSHWDTASYTHYRQPLAHPVGANFREFIFKLRYQPTHRLVFDARAMLIQSGEEAKAGDNIGHDILLNYGTRTPSSGTDTENGYYIKTGVQAKTLIVALDVSYQFHHNYYADLHFFQRKKDSEDNTRDLNTTYFGGGLRVNIGQKRIEF
ncbi:MAG: hypothetical protein RLZZ292_1783 [Bacteroidota bacterium]|jgi:hypothetical protein